MGRQRDYIIQEYVTLMEVGSGNFVVTGCCFIMCVCVCVKEWILSHT